MKILFGLKDVHLLDAYLDHFEALGHSVDGATSVEELYLLAVKLKPDFIISEYQLSGTEDALSLHYELSANIKTSHVQLILISDLPPSLKLGKTRLEGMGITGIIPYKNLSFEAIEDLI